MVSDWSLDGCLGISNVSDFCGNGSGSLSWCQCGDSYVFIVNGGFGYDYWFSGDMQGVVFEGVGKQLICGDDVEVLMCKVVGWLVLLELLCVWVLGLCVFGLLVQICFGID